VPRKKLLKEFVVGVRVLGPERIVVLIRGRELIYTAENIAQILRFSHISPDATPTPMVNLSQQEWDIKISEYFSPDEWNEDQSGYSIRDAPGRWSSRFRAINEVIRMRKKHSYIGRQLLAETLTSHYKPPFNWAATLLAYIEKELNNIQKGRIKYSFLGQWIELLFRDVFPPTEDDDDDELADVSDQGRPSSTAASDQPRDEDAQSSADTQQVPMVQRARRLRNPKRAQVDGEVRSQPSKRRRLVQLSRLPVHLQVPHRMFTRQAARAEIPQRPPIHYLMSSPSLEHSDEQAAAMPTGVARTTAGMVLPTSPPEGEMAPSHLGQPNAQPDDDGFIVQPSQDRTWIAPDPHTDRAISPSHDVEAGPGITRLGSGSPQPVVSDDPVVGQSSRSSSNPMDESVLRCSPPTIFNPWPHPTYNLQALVAAVSQAAGDTEQNLGMAKQWKWHLDLTQQELTRSKSRAGRLRRERDAMRKENQTLQTALVESANKAREEKFKVEQDVEALREASAKLAYDLEHLRAELVLNQTRTDSTQDAKNNLALTEQIASLTLELNVKKVDVQVALNEGDALRSQLQVADYTARARENEWTIAKTELLGQLLNVRQQLAVATSQARPPSQSDVPNEVTNLKGELDKVIRERDEAMAVATTQVRNKARLADYEAMQCEVIAAKALLDAFKKKNPSLDPSNFQALQSKLEVHIQETFEAYQRDEASYRRQLKRVDNAYPHFIYWSDLEDSGDQDIPPSEHGNRTPILTGSPSSRPHLPGTPNSRRPSTSSPSTRVPLPGSPSSRLRPNGSPTSQHLPIHDLTPQDGQPQRTSQELMTAIASISLSDPHGKRPAN
jgi:hypothetical protein